MKYGINMKLCQLADDPEAAALVDRFLPGFRAQAAPSPMAAQLSIRKLVTYLGRSELQSVMPELDAALHAYGANAGLTQAEQKKVEAYQRIARRDAELSAGSEKAPVYTAIRPGALWLDTKGEPIQAHGGAIFYENGTYYWYGENKAHTDGKSEIWTWGIRAYQSSDLYNWRDLGLIIEPVLDDPDASLFPDMRVDRPHIRKCAATGKYVAWLKLSGEEACFLVMQADHFLGPYEIVRENYRPLGCEVGDFDIVQDEESGKAYLFMDADHKGIVGIELSADLLSAERQASMQYAGLFPPFCREGVTLFERNGKKYMMTSGMTGYIPNQSDIAAADSWVDQFAPVGDPCPDDITLSSFNSQFTQVFKLPDRDLYVVLADRWVPDYPVDRRKADMIRRCTAAHYDSARYTVTAEEKAEYQNAPMLETADTSAARYVWLPIEWQGDQPVVRWRDEWRLEDFS